MDELARRHLSLDGIEKADELLVAMTLHVPPRDGSVKNLEGGKKRCRAVPLVIMRDGAAAALLQWQSRLSAVESLDLAFLVHGQNQRMRWWRYIKPHNIPKLLDKLGVFGELELAHTVRLETVAAPDAQHRALRNPDICAMVAEVQCVVSPGGGPWVSSTTRAIVSCGKAGLREGRSCPVKGHRRASCMKRSSKRQTHVLAFAVRRMVSAVPKALIAEKDDPGPPDVLLRSIPVRHDRLQTSTILCGYIKGNSTAHAEGFA